VFQRIFTRFFKLVEPFAFAYGPMRKWGETFEAGFHSPANVSGVQGIIKTAVTILILGNALAQPIGRS
jgi:hypothetical protein